MEGIVEKRYFITCDTAAEISGMKKKMLLNVI